MAKLLSRKLPYYFFAAIHVFSLLTLVSLPALASEQAHPAYISGYSDGSFQPNRALKRAEAAALFFNLIDQPAAQASYRLNFKDVQSDVWYYEAVMELAQQGIISGYQDGTFQPDAAINRAEFVTIALRYANIAEGGTAGFPDVSETNWAAGAISASVEAGFISGYPDGTFRPEQSITRAEAVTVLNKIIGCSGIATGTNFTDVPQSYWAYESITAAATYHGSHDAPTTLVSDPDALIPYLKDGGFGLMQVDGTPVTEAICQKAYIVSYSLGYDDYNRVCLPVLCLEQEDRSYRFAAIDGSWITEPNYTYYYPLENGIFAHDKAGGSVYIGLDGQVIHRWDKHLSIVSDYYSYLTDKRIVLYDSETELHTIINPETGAWIETDIKSLTSYTYHEDGLAPASRQGFWDSGSVDSDGNWISDPEYHALYGYADLDGNWVIEPQYEDAGPFHQGCAMVRRTIASPYLIINRENEVLYEFPEDSRNIQTVLWPDASFYYDYDEVVVGGSLEHFYANKMAESFDPTGMYVYQVINYHIIDGLIFQSDNGRVFVVGKKSLEFDSSTFVSSVRNDIVVLGQTVTDDAGNKEYRYQMVNMEGDVLVPYGVYDHYRVDFFITDDYSGNMYIIAIKGDRQYLLDETGRALISYEYDSSVTAGVENGLIYVCESNNSSYRYYDADGKLVYEWEAAES